MAPEPGKKLFHAIVVVGAALAGCRDDSSDEDEPRANAASVADAGSVVDAAIDAASSNGLDASSSVPDASAALDAGRDAASDAAAVVDASADAARDAVVEDVSFPHITL